MTTLPRLYTWECPACGDDNADPSYFSTHCGHCGLVVVTGTGDARDGQITAFSEGWYVPGYPAKGPQDVHRT